MAIAFDLATYGSFAIAASLSFNHTITGTSPFLLVDVQGDNASDVITGVTANSVAMTLVASVQRTANRWCYTFYLPAPATGSNTIVVSASSSVFIQAIAKSYTGVDQTSPLDAFATNTTAAATSLIVTVNVVGANCWLALFGQVDSGGGQGPVVAGANATVRASDTDFGSNGSFDSNGTLGTGNQIIQCTWTGIGGGVGIACSILPAALGDNFEWLRSHPMPLPAQHRHKVVTIP